MSLVAFPGDGDSYEAQADLEMLCSAILMGHEIERQLELSARTTAPQLAPT